VEPTGASEVLPRVHCRDRSSRGLFLGFLLISGYSIGSSFRRESSGFLRRRAWRIYPVYVGSIALTYLAMPQQITPGFANTIAQNMLFLNQITTNSSFVGPAWTLALEVWLYCLTPWLWRLRTSLLRIMTYASFVAFCGYEMARSALHLKYYSGLGYGLNLPLLSFIWLAGFTLAREPSSARRTIRDCGLIFLAHFLLATAIQIVHRWKHGEIAAFFELDALGYLVRGATLGAVLSLLKWIVAGRAGRQPSNPLRWLGDISYPLYLVHASAFVIAVRIGMEDAKLVLLTAPLTAVLFYYCFDQYSRARDKKPRVAVKVAAAAE
jgi:peptidoglycan/LPS O-acetylase OafA/YrhL